jgi:hypothetical protein
MLSPAVADFVFAERQVLAMQRRTAVRYRCAVGTPGSVALPDGREERNVWVYNLSETGIGLTMTSALEPGTPVVIRLRGPAPGASVALPSRVVHATPEPDGTWLVGCAFTERLTEAALIKLL